MALYVTDLDRLVASSLDKDKMSLSPNTDSDETPQKRLYLKVNDWVEVTVVVPSFTDNTHEVVVVNGPVKTEDLELALTAFPLIVCEATVLFRVQESDSEATLEPTSDSETDVVKELMTGATYNKLAIIVDNGTLL